MPIADLAILVVAIAAIICLVGIALAYFETPVPGWLKHAAGVVFVAFVIIVLIKIVASM
jgi:hypothetical protein